MHGIRHGTKGVFCGACVDVNVDDNGWSVQGNACENACESM